MIYRPQRYQDIVESGVKTPIFKCIVNRDLLKEHFQ